jgi:hypothetical protein
MGPHALTMVIAAFVGLFILAMALEMLSSCAGG